jgi:hypothetical protein
MLRKEEFHFRRNKLLILDDVHHLIMVHFHPHSSKTYMNKLFFLCFFFNHVFFFRCKTRENNDFYSIHFFTKQITSSFCRTCPRPTRCGENLTEMPYIKRKYRFIFFQLSKVYRDVNFLYSQMRIK